MASEERLGVVGMGEAAGRTSVQAGRRASRQAGTHARKHGSQALSGALVGAQAQEGGDRVQRLGVLGALLPDVELAEEEAEDAGLRRR